VICLRSGDSALWLDPELGNIPAWLMGGRAVLHAAPWRDDPAVQHDLAIPLVNRRLAGDFFCMPFGRDDVAGDPPHGLTANTPWQIISQDADFAHLVLSASVRGARVDKRLRLAGQVLYQTHEITGGKGAISFAHHPMARMEQGGVLSFSPKRAVLTDPTPQEPGRTLWALDQMQPDLTLKTVTGGTWDVQSYPHAHRVEDFCILAEAPGASLGWTVLMRHAEDDMLILLKDARVMPVTMLWISNGGRDHAPWNGLHKGVIGIEDGCAAGTTGLATALGANRLTAMGVPTALPLGTRHVIRHAMISAPRPKGWTRVAGLRIAGQTLTLAEQNGETIDIPFDGGFFA
jgi:hypothetical protein